VAKYSKSIIATSDPDLVLNDARIKGIGPNLALDQYARNEIQYQLGEEPSAS